MDLLSALRAHRLVAIVRGDDPDAALRTVLTLAEEGVALIEVSLSGRNALDVIARARTALGPEAPLGAGTVLGPGDARAAHAAGADFIVTPAVGDGITVAKELGMPVLAGVMTPTEILSALRLGAGALKIFPAGQTGARRICGRCGDRSRSCRSFPSKWTRPPRASIWSWARWRWESAHR